MTVIQIATTPDGPPRVMVGNVEIPGVTEATIMANAQGEYQLNIACKAQADDTGTAGETYETTHKGVTYL